MNRSLVSETVGQRTFAVCCPQRRGHFLLGRALIGILRIVTGSVSEERGDSGLPSLTLPVTKLFLPVVWGGEEGKMPRMKTGLGDSTCSQPRRRAGERGSCFVSVVFLFFPPRFSERGE